MAKKIKKVILHVDEEDYRIGKVYDPHLEEHLEEYVKVWANAIRETEKEELEEMIKEGLDIESLFYSGLY